MKITVIGTGYVGLVTGTCLAELGNIVFCLDVDQSKIDMLDRGKIPIYEPGLKELVERNRNTGRLQFSTDVEASVAHGDIQFIAVGTPPDEDGSADLQYVLAAARNIGRCMNGFKVVVNKSTVPVGTAEKVQATIASELTSRGAAVADAFTVVSNPEFLKEGAAVDDFMRPDRIVIGTDATPAGRRAREAMDRLYAPFTRNHDRILHMDVRSAEFTKYAANAMLATRISFMNELANLADKVGVDIYRRIVRGVFHDDESRRMLMRNNRTSPYLWGFTLLTVVPAVLFWNNTPILMLSCAVFVVFYVTSYLMLVRFKVPRWIRRRAR